MGTEDDRSTGGDPAAQGVPLTGMSWQQWPEGLRLRGHQILGQLRSGHPEHAVDLLDELLADLLSRRETLADSANRQFEPSTDDRNP